MQTPLNDPLRLFDRATGPDDERYERPPQNAYGFDLHAGVRTSAHDRKGRQRLGRYLWRPPWSNERLRRTAEGPSRIGLKRPWDDGSVALVVSAEELRARWALLVPPPRVAHEALLRRFGSAREAAPSYRAALPPRARSVAADRQRLRQG